MTPSRRHEHVVYGSPQFRVGTRAPTVGKDPWQKRRLGEYAPHWDPGGDHSPNSLITAAFEQGGFALEIPSPELYYKILPEHAVRKVDERRGVKIRGLWYDGPALKPYHGQGSTRGGRRQTKWIVHREPRDRRTVFFQDPLTHEWHPLRWTGLPPSGVVPAFGDKRVTELLQRVKDAGLRPQTDAELLPHLLELMRKANPVHRWPSRLTKSERVEIARERDQARAAAADHPAGTSSRTPVGTPSGDSRPTPAPTPLNAERGRRWEADDDEVLQAPPRLGEEVRRRNLFALPSGSPDEQAGR
jgi:hypothetical protein